MTAMNGPRVAYCAMLLLLKIAYFHVSAKDYYLIPKRWTLEDMPFLSIIFAKSEYLPDGPCKEDMQRFLHDLLNGSLWATQMFDSSTKYPEGILYGHTRHLGNFDECYNLQVNVAEENAKTREINGKYCLIDIEYQNKYRAPIDQKLSASNYQDNSSDMSNSFWKTVQQLEDFIHVRRNRLQLALCVPATCNAENIEMALRIPLRKLGSSKNIELKTSVQSASCQTAKEAPKYTLGVGIFFAVLLLLLCFVIISTWCDIMSNKNGNHTPVMRNIMLHFSARRNCAKILYVYYTHTGLDFIHSMRLIAIVLSVYMHNIVQYIYAPTINAVYMEKMYNIPFVTIIVNATSKISVFFALGGIVLASQLLKDLDRYKQLNFVKHVVSRYLRLTPTYAIIIGFYIWILPIIGSGPLWYRVLEECTYCVKNWWMNLLYINNYVASQELCVVPGWYLAADFQLFVCSQFVIYAFWCMPRKIGYPFLVVLTLISCTVSFTATYIYGASSVVRFTPFITKETEIPEFGAYYIRGHMCATGYLVGIIAGAIIHDQKGSKWRLSKFWSHILVLPLPVVLSILFQIWAHKFFMSNNTNLLEEAIFAFFHKLIPSLCVCSIIVSLSIGSQLRFYYNLFTPRWVQPLANLCYGVYMVNVMLVMFDAGQGRTAVTFGIVKSIWSTIPLLVISFVFSLFLTLCIEMPCRSLTRWLFNDTNLKIVVKENNIVADNERISEDKVIKTE